MEKKIDGKKRIWVPKNISSVAHPTRQAIIKCPEKGPKTAVDLEKELKESRYNLYHHLRSLREQGFIKERIRGRMKVFELERGRGKARELVADVESLTRVQKAIAIQSVAGAGSAEDPSEQIKLEVKGSLLNRMLGDAGMEKVDGSKNYRVVISEVTAKREEGKKK